MRTGAAVLSVVLGVAMNVGSLVAGEDAAPPVPQSSSQGIARAYYRHPQAGPGVTGTCDNRHAPNSALPSHVFTYPAHRDGSHGLEPAGSTGGIARAWSRQPQAGYGVTGTVTNEQPPNSALVVRGHPRPTT